jgi:hypothetical protein
MSNTDNKTDEQHRQQSKGATQTTKQMNNTDTKQMNNTDN